MLTTSTVQTHFFATTASAWPELAAWVNLKFTNQPASYTHFLILPFFDFLLLVHTHLVRDLFLMLHCLEQYPLQS